MCGKSSKVEIVEDIKGAELSLNELGKSRRKSRRLHRRMALRFSLNCAISVAIGAAGCLRHLLPVARSKAGRVKSKVLFVASTERIIEGR